MDIFLKSPNPNEVLRLQQVAAVSTLFSPSSIAKSSAEFSKILTVEVLVLSTEIMQI